MAGGGENVDTICSNLAFVVEGPVRGHAHRPSDEVLPIEGIPQTGSFCIVWY